ncbi:hypothetical protein ASPSYDRAFT_50325 [Aspergillus sydowii CBS 593.65]|uniref:Uncharacterized protein n=1 Tax=Aspergillus sydowii CBS 593.65 TaxID=1036612 RepID=A0A1L9T4E5_9EURO|nr:uncharacterized protein ASPSYDRAFT_50325 [Aspergillus sydowii CBS 593.65]OJJ54275.1 hypothetical protein ASPSYDRAFT_50325 [Aspergillus sydowii CBS 593.65]
MRELNRSDGGTERTFIYADLVSVWERHDSRASLLAVAMKSTHYPRQIHRDCYPGYGGPATLPANHRLQDRLSGRSNALHYWLSCLLFLGNGEWRFFPTAMFRDCFPRPSIAATTAGPSPVPEWVSQIRY